MWIPYTGKSLSYPKAWYRETAEDEWTEHSDASIEYEESTSFGVVQVDQGGYYPISNEPDPLAYAAVILGALVFVDDADNVLMTRVDCAGFMFRL